MLSELLVIVALVLLNGLFSGAEIAVLSVRKTRLRELVEGGGRRARAVEALRKRPERFLATVQVGITVVSATAAAFGGAHVAAGLTPLLKQLGLGDSADNVALGLVVSGVSFLSIVVGELVPKSLALRASERYALLIGPPLRSLAWLATPIVWLLTASSNLLLRFFGDRTNFTETRISPEEIRQLVEEASQSGQLDAKTSDITTRAFDFENLAATAVMVPRSELVAVPRGAGRDDVLRAFETSGFARLPVYDTTPENVVGHVSAKDVLSRLRHGEEFDLQPLLHPARFIPERVRALDVLRTLQRHRSPLAFLVDEQGGLTGMVTVEDLVEEIVGEIHSENEPPSEHIRLLPDGGIVVDGRAAVHDINRELELNLPEGRDWTTIAGLAISLAGQMPRPGTRVTAADGTTLEIIEASPRRVHALRLHRAPKPPPDDDGDEGLERTHPRLKSGAVNTLDSARRQRGADIKAPPSLGWGSRVVRRERREPAPIEGRALRAVSPGVYCPRLESGVRSPTGVFERLAPGRRRPRPRRPAALTKDRSAGPHVLRKSAQNP
jgi:putative hemolysin